MTNHRIGHGAVLPIERAAGMAGHSLHASGGCLEAGTGRRSLVFSPIDGGGSRDWRAVVRDRTSGTVIWDGEARDLGYGDAYAVAERAFGMLAARDTDGRHGRTHGKETRHGA